MRSEHVSDEQLQQFAIDSSACEPAARAHIDGCAECQAKAAYYAQMMAAIEVQPLPLPGFDTSELVLARIETRQHNGWIYLLLAVVVLLFSGGMYWFRAHLFNGLSIFFICLLAVTTACILIAAVIDQVKIYQHKMNILATK